MAEKRDTPQIRFNDYTNAWEQCRLEEIVDVRSGKDYKNLSKGDIPVYGTGGYMLSVNKALSYDRDAIGIGRKGTINKPYVLQAPALKSNPIIEGTLMFHTTLQQYSPYTRYRG